jgi:hypothetical protein
MSCSSCSSGSCGTCGTTEESDSTVSFKSNKVRLVVDLPLAEADMLGNLARSQGITVTEALRRAIMDTAYISERVTAGKKLLLTHEDGSITEVVFSWMK